MMPNKYTEEELNYMRENYGQKTNEEIAEELGRTMVSVRTKAYKMNLKKNDETVVHRRVGIEDYAKYAESKEVREDEQSKFISGVIIGESSFVHREEKNKFRFSLGMSEKDKPLVQYVDDFFQLGDVYKWDNDRDNEENVYQLKIHSEQDLIEEIIPFMQTNLKRNTNKWSKYVDWRDKLLSKHGFQIMDK